MLNLRGFLYHVVLYTGELTHGIINNTYCKKTHTKKSNFMFFCHFELIFWYCQFVRDISFFCLLNICLKGLEVLCVF